MEAVYLAASLHASVHRRCKYTAGACLPACGYGLVISCPVWPSNTGKAAPAGAEAVQLTDPQCPILTTVHNIFQAERNAYILNGIYSIY